MFILWQTYEDIKIFTYLLFEVVKFLAENDAVFFSLKNSIKID